MIVINFKAYEKATGKEAGKLGELCEEAAEETEKRIIACPSSTDLLRLEDLELEVFGQHIDPVEPGSHTGSVLAETIEDAGSSGTLINHSEKRIEDEKIKKAVEKCREKGLTSIVCAQNPEECERFSRFNPDYIAYEPPELIGGDVSVSEAKPELIEEAVEKAGETPALTGAGIKDKEDVEKSIELGCEGVLVASGVVKSDDPKHEIKQLCEGL